MKQLLLIILLALATTAGAEITDSTFTEESNGNRNFVEYYEDGSVKAEGSYDLLNNKIGTWYGYHENGERSVKAQFSLDARHGTWEHYDMDGNLVMKLVYRYNKMVEGWMAKDGVLIHYDMDGGLLTRQ